MKSIVKSVQQYFLSFLQLQLLLTCVSLPFLIAWGLPLSLISCIGNCIFSPFLTCFLFLSSLIFFTEILHIPNGLLVYSLNTLSSIWTTILSYGPSCALIGFRCPPTPVLILFSCAALSFLLNKKISTIPHRIIYCTFLLIFVGVLLKLTLPTPEPHIETLTIKKSNLTFIIHQNMITLIDHGAIGRQASAESFVEYTLLPTLTKLSGALHIDTLVLLRPTKRLFLAIAHLSNLIPIKKIYLSSWEDQIIDRSFWSTFWKFKTTIEKNKCDLKRIGPKDHTIQLSYTSFLTLIYTNTFKQYGAKIPQFTAQLSGNHTQYSLE